MPWRMIWSTGSSATRLCRCWRAWCCCRSWGVVLSAIGLDPWNIVHSVEKLIRDVWEMGFDAVRWIWRYFLLGAVLVVPIWLLVRLARGTAGRA